MPRRCTICTHPKRKEIEKALLESVPFRTIAGKYNVSQSATDRHRKHMAGAVEKAAEKAEGKATAATWDLFEKLFEQAIGFQADIELALANDNIRAATAARREKSRLLDMLHRFRDANRLSADDFLRAQVNWAQVTAGVAKEFMTEEQHAVFCEKLQAALREVRV